jgi:ELWxxDGT repeat protein
MERLRGTGPLVPGWEHDDYTGGTRRFDEWFGRSDQFAYFSADVLYGSNSFKDELWKSDGTTSGTALVKRFDDGSGELLGFTPRGVRFRSMVFFSARAAGDLLLGLWKSDGTLEGTIPVPAPQVVDPRNFSPLQKHTFFTAELPGIRYIFGLWKSDGTGEGTVYLNPIIPTTSVVGAGRPGLLQGRRCRREGGAALAKQRDSRGNAPDQDLHSRTGWCSSAAQRPRSHRRRGSAGVLRGERWRCGARALGARHAGR